MPNIRSTDMLFLDDLFEDRVVIWITDRGIGGWHLRGDPFVERATARKYLWSGPVAAQ